MSPCIQQAVLHRRWGTMKTSKCCGMSQIMLDMACALPPAALCDRRFLGLLSDSRTVRFRSLVLSADGKAQKTRFQGICAELLKGKIREPVLPLDRQNLSPPWCQPEHGKLCTTPLFQKGPPAAAASE